MRPSCGLSWSALSKLTVHGFAFLSVALQTRTRKNARCQSHSIQIVCISHSRELLSTSEYRATARVCTSIYDVATFQTTITIFMEITYNSSDSDGRSILRCGSAPTRLLGLWVRIPPGGMSLVCCVVEVSATGRSLVRRRPTECGVPECDRGTSRRPWPTRDCRAIKNLITYFLYTTPPWSLKDSVLAMTLQHKTGYNSVEMLRHTVTHGRGSEGETGEWSG